MASKTEDELRLEQASLVASAADISRQLAALSLTRGRAFLDVLQTRLTSADISAIEEAAAGLPDFSGRYAANLIEMMKVTPDLLAIEVAKLERASLPSLSIV